MRGQATWCGSALTWGTILATLVGVGACTPETKVETKIVQGDCAPGTAVDAADTQGPDVGAQDVQVADVAPPNDAAAEVLPTDATAAADTSAPDVQADASGDIPVPGEYCGNCHTAQVNRYLGGQHKGLKDNCVSCHENALVHQADPKNVQAKMEFTLESGGTCHKSHLETYLKDDDAKAGKYGGSKKTSKYLEIPNYVYLMGGHGFTIEYNEERAHKFMLKDHIEIKRKQNVVCLQCKSTPVTYYWNESRRGKAMFNKEQTWQAVIDKLKAEHPKTIDYGASCTHCHDPHSGGYRLIRKAVVQAILERGTDPYSAKYNYVPKSPQDLDTKLNERGADGKLTASARRMAGTLTCAQCHIEYTCGPGVDKETGILRDEVPWRKLAELEAYYKAKFNMVQDWKHAVVGENGVKAQHPETEFYWGSSHANYGASCASCHMAKDPTGKGPKSHWLTSPLKQPDVTCGQCHDDVPERLVSQGKDQDAFWAKAQKAEAALAAVLKAIETAKAASPAPAGLAQAKELFLRGLFWWEFTAVSENSAGWHNPVEGHVNLDKALQFAADAAAALAPK